MYRESSKIPYLASMIISQEIDEKVLDDFKDPTKYDVSIYNQYSDNVLERLEQTSRSHTKLAVPTPVPTPAVVPPPMLNLPQPTYAGAPAPYLVPPPSMLVPPPVSVPAYAIPPVPAPVVSSFSVSQSTQNHSNIVTVPTTGSGSKLAREFFKEKDLILIDDGSSQKASETENQKNYEKLLKNQLEAKEMMRNDGTSGRKTAERTIPDPKYTSDKEMSVIDHAIASLDREIQNKRRGKPAEVELDRFGYVVRSNNSRPSTDPAEFYKSMFPQGHGDAASRRRKRTRSRSVSPSKRRRTRSRSRSRGRRARTTRSRSRGRHTRSRSRGRKTRSRSRGRHTRSRSRERRRRSPRQTEEERRGRRRPSKSPIRTYAADGTRKRSKSRSKSKSRDKDGTKRRSKYAGPPVPSFMLHPADRLFSGDVGRSNSVRKRMEMRKDQGFDVVDEQKAALDESLSLITQMQSNATSGETNKEPIIVTMEVEVLDDGGYRQFTQIGIGCEDRETGVYNKSLFKAILPTYMEQYENNLILKNQKNLHSSLKFNYDEDNKSYTFQHIKKGVVELVTEETALNHLVAFIKTIKQDQGVVIFTLNQATFVPLLLSRLTKYGIFDEFSAVVRGFCDFTSCIANLKLSGVWKETKFSDLVDVYKHIMGKSWPRESRHCDGISVLSGTVLRKMMADYTEYLNDMNLKLSYSKFLKVCGLLSPAELMVSMKSEVAAVAATTQSAASGAKELELKPSDRPGEITIITLKRFECIDVPDVDEVEEEGINEDDYFSDAQCPALVRSEKTIKPGFVDKVILKVTTDKKPNNKWCLVHKNTNFGAAIIKSEDKSVNEEQKKRINKAKQCQVSRQIVQIQYRHSTVITVKILNPLDSDLVLHAGDEVAMVRIEKDASPGDPMCKTYSQIKEEALNSAKESVASSMSEAQKHAIVKEVVEDLVSPSKAAKKYGLSAITIRKWIKDAGCRCPSKAELEEARKIKGKPVNDPAIKGQQNTNKAMMEVMKEVRQEALKEKVDEENENATGVKKKKRKRSTKKNKNGIADKTHIQDVSVEVIDSDEEVPVHEKDAASMEDVLSDEDFAAAETSEAEDVVSLSSLSDGEVEQEPPPAVSCDELSDTPLEPGSKEVSPVFYTSQFYVQTHNMFTSLGGMETSKCLMVIKEDHGFTGEDFDGKKCRITINPDYEGVTTDSDPQYHALRTGKKVNTYFVQELETEVWLSKDPKSSAMLPLVDVEITNNTATGNHYPKGVALAVCKFINPGVSSKNRKEVSFAPEDTVLDMPDPVACISENSSREVRAGAQPAEPGPDSGSSPTFTLKCYPARSFALEAGSTTSVTLIVAEDKDNTMERLLGSECVIRRNQTESSYSIFRILKNLHFLEQKTKIVKYRSSNSGSTYPSVTVTMRNLSTRRETFSRSLPVALCVLKTSSLSVSVNNDLFEGNLPTPVPAITSSGEELSVDKFTTVETWGLPDPVPISSDPLASTPAPPLPSQEELKVWSVKKLKSCLGDAGLHQYGLKNDLVQRLHDYYSKNPSKIPQPPLSSKDVASEVLSGIIHNAILFSNSKHKNGGSITASCLKQIVVDDGHGRNVALAASNGVYIFNGRQIPVLGASSPPKAVSAPSINREIVPVDPKSAEHEKLMKKIGEIKSFEKLNLDFFKNGNSIICSEDIKIGPREKKIVTFRLSELDLFASELAGRRVLIKERDNDRDILTVTKQITNIIINERKSEIDVLVENSFDREVVVKASDKIKLIRVYLERMPKDLDHQFDIPEDDDVLDVVETLLNTETLDAATTEDIVLQPKTYHTGVCSVKLTRAYDFRPFALMERTKASSMKIGMRKMIIIPKVQCFLTTQEDSCEATLMIKMYNASKQTLRITKKTKIALVRVQKDESVFSDKEYEVEPDQRRKYGDIKEGFALHQEGSPVLLSFTHDGVTRPSVVNIVSKNNKLCVPLGSEASGGYHLVKF